MQHNHDNMRIIYVNKRHNYVDIRHILTGMLTYEIYFGIIIFYDDMNDVHIITCMLHVDIKYFALKRDTSSLIDKKLIRIISNKNYEKLISSQVNKN